MKQFVKRTEKQGDVNLAISIIDDGHMNLYDHAYLVTNDTDQVATLRMFNHRFIHLGKKVSVVTPPGRIPSGQLKAMVGNKQRMLKDTDIENCLFPSRVSGIVRPTEYDPPTGFALSPAPLQTISSLIPKPPAPNWGHDTKVRTVSASIEH